MCTPEVATRPRGKPHLFPPATVCDAVGMILGLGITKLVFEYFPNAFRSIMSLDPY